jgi:hypothetical protein
MLNGDLDNKVSPRLLLVFEGALGIKTDGPGFDRAVRKHRWAQVMDCWELNELMARRLLWLYYNRDVNYEIVTFLGDDFARELSLWINDVGLPVHRVWATTPDKLGRTIAYMPDLACVYDPEPTRWLMYGGKGRFLERVSQIGEGM